MNNPLFFIYSLLEPFILQKKQGLYYEDLNNNIKGNKNNTRMLL